MLRRFKTLILFVVLAAMSLRGMAAVDMWHCAHDQSRHAIFASADEHAQQHGMQGDRTVDRSEHPDHPDHDASAQSDPVEESAPQAGAHCISGAAAPVERVSFSFAPVGAIRIPFVEQRIAVVVPARLDRPPLLQSL